MNTEPFYFLGDAIYRRAEPGCPDPRAMAQFVARTRLGAHPELGRELVALLNAGAAAQDAVTSLRKMVDFHAGEDDADLPDLAEARAVVERIDGVAEPAARTVASDAV